MFGLLTRSPRPRNTALGRSVRLTLERLEDRLSPTMMDGLTMTVTYDPNKQVTLSGHLTSPNNVGQVILFGGVVNGSAITDSQGNYSATLNVLQLGQVTAVEVNVPSNTASAMLVSQIPTITFTATPEGNGVWLFSGTVGNDPTQGEVVNFGGITPLAGESTTVDPDGTFSFICTVASGQGGMATAQAVDWWGDESQIATASVYA
jgi:hypothetical protein